ncbi:MAG: hypothetical protein ACRDP6_35150 [Actinoallomurus sp.]
MEAGRGISLPDYFRPPDGATNVYVLLEMRGTFTDGSRATPAPMDALFDFHAPECGDHKRNTSCSSFSIPMIGGLAFLTEEEVTNDPASLFKRPQRSPSPPQLRSGVPYYTLVAEAIPENIRLRDITFCNDKKCLSLGSLPAGTL